VSLRRVGLLTPFQEIPGEVEDVVADAREPAALWQVVTEATDSHTLEALRETGSGQALLPAVERMRRWGPDVIAWACTGGSFIGGRSGACAQIAAIESVAGVPATSTSLAFVEALAALEIDRVAVVAPYPEPAAEAFESFLGEWGIAVRGIVSLGCAGASTSQLLTAEDVENAADSLGAAASILLPDTAVWGIEIHRELAPRLSVPLLVANQVTLWHAFELAGMSTDLAAFGDLGGIRAATITRPRLAGARS
jgi:maleate cis-trans isomerase